MQWWDPSLTAAQAAGRTGLEFMQALADGKIPPPPIAMLFGMFPTRVERGLAQLGPLGDPGRLGDVPDGRAWLAAAGRGDQHAAEHAADTTLPQALSGTGARGCVTGITAEQLDFRDQVGGQLPVVIAAAFLLLLSTNVVVKMLALGLGVSILIDATVIRLIVVPATMFLLRGTTGGSRPGWTGRSRTWSPRGRPRGHGHRPLPFNSRVRGRGCCRAAGAAG